VSGPRPGHVAAITWLNEAESAAFYIVKVEVTGAALLEQSSGDLHRLAAGKGGTNPPPEPSQPGDMPKEQRMATRAISEIGGGGGREIGERQQIGQLGSSLGNKKRDADHRGRQRQDLPPIRHQLVAARRAKICNDAVTPKSGFPF
jgi:hypothetical protein